LEKFEACFLYPALIFNRYLHQVNLGVDVNLSRAVAILLGEQLGRDPFPSVNL